MFTNLAILGAPHCTIPVVFPISSSNICHGAQLGGEHGWVVPVVAVGGLGPSRGSRGRGNGGTRVWGEDVSRRRAKRWLSCSWRWEANGISMVSNGFRMGF